MWDILNLHSIKILAIALLTMMISMSIIKAKFKFTLPNIRFNKQPDNSQLFSARNLFTDLSISRFCKQRKKPITISIRNVFFLIVLFIERTATRLSIAYLFHSSIKHECNQTIGNQKISKYSEFSISRNSKKITFY